MPIYEFECQSCGGRFESLVALGTESEPCRLCGSTGAERRISTFSDLSRQMTPSQRRRAEDARGVNRDGARNRFKRSLAKNRGRSDRG